MKPIRFFKTILMTDFLGGLFIALKEFFKSKHTRIYTDNSKGDLVINLKPGLISTIAFSTIFIIDYKKKKLDMEKYNKNCSNMYNYLIGIQNYNKKLEKIENAIIQA